MNQKNVVTLQDSDWTLDLKDTIGRCSINPTPVELAQGIIKAKDCYSEGENEAGENIRMDGQDGNIHELLIGVMVKNN